MCKNPIKYVRHNNNNNNCGRAIITKTTTTKSSEQVLNNNKNNNEKGKTNLKNIQQCEKYECKFTLRKIHTTLIHTNTCVCVFSRKTKGLSNCKITTWEASQQKRER